MPSPLKAKYVLLALLALLLLGGCGYHTAALRGPLAEANGVNVTLFANKSYRPGVEGVLARNMVDELALRTGGRVLSRNEAQLELTGVILSYMALPVSYTSQDIIKEYRAIITVQAVLQDKRTLKVLWKGELKGDQTFPVSTNIALQQNAEAAATDKICRNISEELWRRIGEQF